MSHTKPSLSDLRIDDHARYGGSGRMGLAVLLLLAAAVAGAALWYWLHVPRAVPVRVASVAETSANAGSGGPAVLNASGAAYQEAARYYQRAGAAGDLARLHKERAQGRWR